MTQRPPVNIERRFVVLCPRPGSLLEDLGSHPTALVEDALAHVARLELVVVVLGPGLLAANVVHVVVVVVT